MIVLSILHWVAHPHNLEPVTNTTTFNLIFVNISPFYDGPFIKSTNKLKQSLNIYSSIKILVNKVSVQSVESISSIKKWNYYLSLYSIWYSDNQVLLLIYFILYHPAQALVRIIIYWKNNLEATHLLNVSIHYFNFYQFSGGFPNNKCLQK